MTLKQLKEQIIKNKKLSGFTIFLCLDSDFIAEQYIEYICKNGHLNYNSIETLAETKESALSLVFDFAENLNVLKTDAFSEYQEDYTSFNSCVVLCNKIDNKIKDKVADYIVTFEKPLDWQIEDYIKVKCKSLSQQDADWLISATKGNLYRIDSELDKLNLFDTEQQRHVFDSIRFDKETDLILFDEYTLANAITSLDKAKVAEYFMHKKYVAEEPITLNIGLLKSFKKILFAKYGNMKPEEIGMSPGQYSYIRRNNGLSKEFLLTAIEFLSDIDIKARSGLLPVEKDSLLDYIILKLFSIKN